MRRYWHDIPTAIISFYPYYLYDAPRVPIYINAYCTIDECRLPSSICCWGAVHGIGAAPLIPIAGSRTRGISLLREARSSESASPRSCPTGRTLFVRYAMA